MTGKQKTVYCCSECGYEAAKWVGRCPDCGSWNSMTEQNRAPAKSAPAGFTVASKPAAVERLSDISSGEEIRYMTGIDEMDRVLGGGLVPGSVVLLSGDPGIGKSTLLLQLCSGLSKEMKIVYATGEESARQIKLRAMRLGVEGDNLYICASTDLDQMIAAVEQSAPELVIVDSIQTMQAAGLSSSPGSVAQTRECTQRLLRMAKEHEIPVFLIGHVNKDGAIAGPKVLEHMVDAVLYLEGERHLQYRILRAVKNRFGSTNEIGVFEMQDSGLKQVDNPSMMLLSGRLDSASGSCVTCVIEGSRPILSEIQALVCKSSYPVPKRTATGFDFNRTAMLLAVLEKRCGYSFGNLDAYINVVGGLRLDEPSADLAVAMALLSNLVDKPIDPRLAVFGEIGLAGEIRTVNRAQARVSEAYRLGFTRILLPKQNSQKLSTEAFPDLELIPVRQVGDLRSVLG